MLGRYISIALWLAPVMCMALESETCVDAVCSEHAEQVSSALLQTKRRVAEKSVVAEAARSRDQHIRRGWRSPSLSNHTRKHTSLISQIPDLSASGASAPLTEEGYTAVASMCCPMEARVFGQRLVSHLGFDVCDTGDLSGLMSWYFCSTQNGTFEDLKTEIMEATVGECAWAATPGSCRMPWTRIATCPFYDDEYDPSNIIGTRGTCCYPSASTALLFSGARVVSNNLGGKGPNLGDPQELRYTGVGAKDGRSLDLKITAGSGYSGSANNGLNGLFGIVGVYAGTSVDLTFTIQDSVSKAPVSLDEFYVSLLDVDEEQTRIKERVYVRYGGALVDRVMEPTDRGMTEVELADGRTVYESIITAGAWNNPTDPMKLGVVNNPSTYGIRSINQRKTALMFIYRKTSTWTMTLEVTHTEGAPHGRNYIFGGTSAIIDICPQKEEPKEETVSS